MTPNTKKLTDLESQLKQKLHIGSRNTFAPVESPCKPAEMNGAKTQQTRQPPSLQTPLSTQHTLLSPQVFTSVVARSSSPTNTNGHNGVGFPPRATITPLTQDQMVEAMSFLLESDPDFVQKLHEAYVKSLSRKFQIMK
jgi:mRNA-decapping enzyme 1B